MEFIYVRSKSDDRSIWTSVVDDDEYRIEHLEPQDIVLDIGMHTGSFIHRAWLAGSRALYGFEVDEENFRLAQANVGTRAQVVNAAVVRSDARASDRVYYTGHVPMEHELNTGVGTIFGNEGQRAVATMPLDEILLQLGTVRLIKLDTEGSEWPILMGSSRLGQVQEIIGEWHLNHVAEIEQLGFPCNLPSLQLYLTKNGFQSRFYAREEDMPSPIVGYFRAVRNSIGDPWRIGEDRRLVCASGS